MRFLHRTQLAGAVALRVAPRIARAQTYPMRHITIVVPFAPGGTLDALARIIVMVVTACLGGAEAPASAQTYPSRPITVIVPYAAGGGTDVTARLVAQRMRIPLGQPVIVENVTGAGGSIGAGRVARAAPDGYTISLGRSGHTCCQERCIHSNMIC